MTIVHARLAAAAAVCCAAGAAQAALNATVYDGWQRGGVLYGDSGDITFDGLTVLTSFVDPNIDHWDGTGGYRWMPAGQDELYSVRWTGWLNAASAGAYNFRTTSDDGVQVVIGSTTVVDAPVLQYFGTNTGSTTLAAGWVPIEVRFYENAVFDGIVLEWQRPGDAGFAVVPESAFALAPVPELPPAAMFLLGLPLLAAVRRRTGRR